MRKLLLLLSLAFIAIVLVSSCAASHLCPAYSEKIAPSTAPTIAPSECTDLCTTFQCTSINVLN